MKIISNGSKWYGEEHDSIGILLLRLEHNILDFASVIPCKFIGKELYPPQVLYQVLGDFIDVSHIFHVIGTKEELKLIINAINRNQNNKAYNKKSNKFIFIDEDEDSYFCNEEHFRNFYE